MGLHIPPLADYASPEASSAHALLLSSSRAFGDPVLEEILLLDFIIIIFFRFLFKQFFPMISYPSAILLFILFFLLLFLIQLSLSRLIYHFPGFPGSA